MQTIQRKYFFDNVRPLFGGKLTDSQVEGLIAIVNEYERRKLDNTHWLAYILATVFHETDKTMQPIEEYGKGKGRAYSKQIRYNGKQYSTPNHIFYGRGLTQNTWIDIYEKLTKAAKRNGHDWDFVNNPELLLKMEPSVWVTFYAMIFGIYTGKSLADYFYGSVADWINARRIINGTDRAKDIAEIAITFYNAIQLISATI